MKNLMIRSALVALAGIGLLSAADDNSQGNNNNQGEDTKPNGRGGDIKPAHDAGKSRKGGGGGNGISYHNGPIILNTTNVYYIWYGTWPGGSVAKLILPVLAGSIGGSPYFNINTTYYNGAGVHVTNAVNYGGATTDNYSQGTQLNDNSIAVIVSKALTTGGGSLPVDTNGVYFVLTSSDVNETTGFCTQYCGWHWWGTLNGQAIKYAFVGDPTNCLSACTNGTPSPNGNRGADGMASVIAHELEEAVTDPQGTAWYDNGGNENADKCAWTFGTTYSSNGGVANMKLGGTDFLIQRNWINASGGSCALKYP